MGDCNEPCWRRWCWCWSGRGPSLQGVLVEYEGEPGSVRPRQCRSWSCSCPSSPHLVTGDTWLKSAPPPLHPSLPTSVPPPSPTGLLPDGSSQFVAAGFSLLAAGRRSSRRYLLCEPLCERHAGDIISFHPGPQKVICCNPNRFQAEPETPGPGSRCW